MIVACQAEACCLNQDSLPQADAIDLCGCLPGNFSRFAAIGSFQYGDGGQWFLIGGDRIDVAVVDGLAVFLDPFVPRLYHLAIDKEAYQLHPLCFWLALGGIVPAQSQAEHVATHFFLSATTNCSQVACSAKNRVRMPVS